MTRRDLICLCAFAALLFHPALGRAQAAPPAGPVRIALVSDPHVNLATTGDEANYRARFLRVIDDVNAADVSFVLIAGDLTQGGRPEQMDAFAALIKGFRAPVRVVFGNHDVGQKVGVSGAKPGADVTAGRVARFEKAFGPSFFAETLAGIRVVGFNTPILGSGLPVEAEQWDFLDRELAPATTAGPPILLVTHYPLYLAQPDEPGGLYWNVEPAPRARLLALVRKNPRVRAILSGHLHRPLENRMPGGVLLSTTPPVSFGLPTGKQPEGWTLVTVTPATGAVQTEFRAIPHIGLTTASPVVSPSVK